MPHDHERETLPNGLPPGTNPDKSISRNISPGVAGQDRLEIFHQHRRRLLSIAYRMLGSVSDAEDMLQETFIRWQQSSDAEIESSEAFLVTIISRLCLNYLQSARVKREEYFGQWLPEPVVTEPASNPYLTSLMDGEVSMAFLVLLERLTPLERAAFLLREAFEYEYAEITRILEQTEANCRQLFRRARQHLKEERPRFESSPKQREELLERFLQASLRGEMDGLLALFSKEIVLYADGGGEGDCGAESNLWCREPHSFPDWRATPVTACGSRSSGEANQWRSRSSQLLARPTAQCSYPRHCRWTNSPDLYRQQSG